MAATVKSYTTKLPYDQYLDLKQCVYGENLELNKPDCFTIKGNEITEATSQTNALFAINPEVKDFCDTLDQSIAYILKVKAGVITNNGINSCLRCIENKQAVNLLIRITVHKKTKKIENDDHDQTNFEQYKNSCSKKEKVPDSLHFVSEVEYGQEMICFLSFYTESESLKKDIRNKLNCFVHMKGSLNDSKCQSFLTVMKEMDQSLSSEAYKTFHCEITTMSCKKFRPTSLSSVAAEIMNCFQQDMSTEIKNKPLYVDVTAITTDTTVPLSVACNEENRNSKLFPLRITLKSFIRDDTRVKTIQDLEDLCYQLYGFLIKCDDQEKEIDAFCAKPEFKSIIDQLKLDGKKKYISEQRTKVQNAIKQCVLTYFTEDFEKEMLSINMHEGIARSFIDNTLTVPAGDDQNLLLFGKTGNGKTATMNSIINVDEPGRITPRKFTMASDTSVASLHPRSYGTRTINVIDTVGLYKTTYTDESDIYADAVNAITEGIVKCKGKFSLGLVYNLNTRYSKEEKNTIRLIKIILGEDALKKHAVLILTHADEFRAKSHDSFENWMQTNPNSCSEFNDLFNECGRKFVLFDNVTDNLDVRLAQLIQLVKLLDQLSSDQYSEEMYKTASLKRAQLFKNDPTHKQVFQDSAEIIYTYFSNWKEGSKVDNAIKKQLKDLSKILNEKSENQTTNKLCVILKYVNNQLLPPEQLDAKAVKKLIQAIEENHDSVQQRTGQNINNRQACLIL